MELSGTDLAIAKTLPKIYGMTPFYRLRWRFEFFNKPDKVGVWNAASKEFIDMATSINKTGLSRVYVEGEKVGSWSNHKFFSVDGQAYAHMKWHTMALAPAFSKTIKYESPGTIIGLSIFTDQLEIIAFIDGQVKTKPITKNEKKFKVLEHTSGV